MATTPIPPAGSGTELDPWIITSLANLRAFSENTSYWAIGTYTKVTSDIDASDTATWNSGAGFSPIGNSVRSYNGTFYGAKIISNLYINRPTLDRVGLFGDMSIGIVSEIGLENCSVLGRDFVGGLVGYQNSTSVIERCFSTGTVEATRLWVGGLVGYQIGTTHNLNDSYSLCNVIGGTFNAGGLLGGYNPRLTNCYSTGTVTDASIIGGLVGRDLGNSDVVGGYWDTETSGLSTSAGGVGKTTAEMYQQSTFVGWDFVNTWTIQEGLNYPELQWATIIPVVSDFEGVPTSGKTPLIVQFTDLSINDPDTWLWDIPGADPFDTALQNPEVTFSVPGLYTVTLTATNSAGGTPETKIDYIEVLPAEEYHWDFGDGSPIFVGDNPPAHTYQKGGEYTLTCTEINSGKSHSEIVTVFEESVVNGRAILRRYPTGRAWKGNLIKALCDGIGREFGALASSFKILANVRTILFGENLSSWEYILGLFPVGTIEEREAAVVSKLGNASQAVYDEYGSQSENYIEKVLRDAGFDVYVHKSGNSNLISQSTTFGGGATFGGAWRSSIDGSLYDPPFSRFGDIAGIAASDPSLQSGELCVNFVDSEKDEAYSSKITSDSRRWKYLFFVGGQNLGDFAIVPLARKEEFRRLILEIKPMGDWAKLQVTYI